MQVFQAAAERTLINSLVRDVRNRAAADLAVLDDATLTKIVCGLVARARTYGLTWESTLAGFVYVAVEVSPNWDGHPDLHAALVRRRVAADVLFNGLFSDGFDRAWDEATAMRSGAGWFLPDALPWTQRRARIAAALPAALAPAGEIDPAMSATLADTGMGLAAKAGVESEDGAFLLAVGAAVAGNAELRAPLHVLSARSVVGEPTRVRVLRGWVRHNTSLWV